MGGRRVREGRDPELRLREFQARLGELTFFDPACGCGNFLVIAYRELRRLELQVIREHERDETGAVASRLDVGSLSRLDVDQFYGIEIGEFPARIAEVALWMMDHLMNNELSLEFGQSYARIPLKQSPHIRCADALEMDWGDLLPAKDSSFVFGNPPFGQTGRSNGHSAELAGKAMVKRRIPALFPEFARFPGSGPNSVLSG